MLTCVMLVKCLIADNDDDAVTLDLFLDGAFCGHSPKDCMVVHPEGTYFLTYCHDNVIFEHLFGVVGNW